MQAKLHPITQTDRELRRSIKRLEAYKDSRVIHLQSHDIVDKLIDDMKELRRLVPSTYRDKECR
jgi:hypothetical protein